jgi:hypothetical protein
MKITHSCSALYALLACAPVMAAGFTYEYTGPLHGSITNSAACAAQTSTDCYAPGARVTGYVTTATPIPPNFSGSIVPMITHYQFTDGVNTISSDDAHARTYRFDVQTDASGNITSESITLDEWRSGTAPHAPGTGVNTISNTSGVMNVACNVVGVTPAGVADGCIKTALAGIESSRYDPGTGSGTWRFADMVLRDGIYLYDQPLYSNTMQYLSSYNCDAVQLVLDVTSGHADIWLNQGGADTNRLYPDRILAEHHTFAYAMYNPQSWKWFNLSDRGRALPDAEIGRANIFGYCYSTKPGAFLMYIDDKTHTCKYSPNRGNRVDTQGAGNACPASWR